MKFFTDWEWVRSGGSHWGCWSECRRQIQASSDVLGEEAAHANAKEARPEKKACQKSHFLALQGTRSASAAHHGSRYGESWIKIIIFTAINKNSRQHATI